MFRGPTHRLFRGLSPRRVPISTCRSLWPLVNRVVPIPIVGLQIAIVIAYNLLGFFYLNYVENSIVYVILLASSEIRKYTWKIFLNQWENYLMSTETFYMKLHTL